MRTNSDVLRRVRRAHQQRLARRVRRAHQQRHAPYGRCTLLAIPGSVGCRGAAQVVRTGFSATHAAGRAEHLDFTNLEITTQVVHARVVKRAHVRQGRVLGQRLP